MIKGGGANRVGGAQEGRRDCGRGRLEVTRGWLVRGGAISLSNFFQGRLIA